MEFGYFPVPNAEVYPQLLRQVRYADAAGLELIGIQDHPYQRTFLDAWTLITGLAVQTERLRFFLNVANLALRPPAMLAKAVASLDVMTGGRIELGLGAGYFWQGIAAMGGPTREPGEAVDALEEAIHVCRLMWRGDAGARFEGEHYQLRGANPGPVPAHPAGIWLGAIGPRMLGVTGRLCDGWVPSSPYVPPDQLMDSHRRIDEAAEAAGRDPGAIRRIYNVMGSITESGSGDYLEGPVERWVDELTSLVLDKRMDTLIFAPNESTESQLRLFVEEVVPRVKEAVGHRD
jgi:alkanesulfonate monooxygenase SsuD/methylene tetrahydromethanopterin reductase-like flavin-dependent oxidoreductase (luciferase family)